MVMNPKSVCRVLKHSPGGAWVFSHPKTLDLRTGHCDSSDVPRVPCRTVLMSALCNPHTHVGDRQFRGSFPLESLAEYLAGTERILGNRPAADRDRLCMEHYREMQASGVWSFCASNFEPRSGDYSSGNIVSGYILSGIPRLKRFRSAFPESFMAFVERVRAWPGIRPGLFLHEVQALSDAELSQAGQVVRQAGALLAGHACETPSNRNDIRRLHDAGLLALNPLLAHCVHVDDEDLKMICTHGGRICLCFTSNLSTGVGLPPVARMIQHGLKPALATDGPGTCPAQDLFREASLAALLHRDIFRGNLSQLMDMLLLYSYTALGIPYENPGEGAVPTVLVDLEEDIAEDSCRLACVLLKLSRRSVVAMWNRGRLVYLRDGAGDDTSR